MYICASRSDYHQRSVNEAWVFSCFQASFVTSLFFYYQMLTDRLMQKNKDKHLLKTSCKDGLKGDVRNKPILLDTGPLFVKPKAQGLVLTNHCGLDQRGQSWHGWV